MKKLILKSVLASGMLLVSSAAYAACTAPAAKDDLTDADWDHMGKVVAYINRHCAQVPSDPEGSDWAYSLKNWGHDPFRNGGCA